MADRSYCKGCQKREIDVPELSEVFNSIVFGKAIDVVMPEATIACELMSKGCNDIFDSALRYRQEDG